jgi:hypothetical protein
LFEGLTDFLCVPLRISAFFALKSYLTQKTQRYAEERRESSLPLFTIRIQPPGELTPKFWEIARPDRLPHASHGVKEEGQIMVCQKDAGQHLAAHI